MRSGRPRRGQRRSRTAPPVPCRVRGRRARRARGTPPRNRRRGTRPALPSSRTPAPHSGSVPRPRRSASTPAGRASARGGGRGADSRCRSDSRSPCAGSRVPGRDRRPTELGGCHRPRLSPGGRGDSRGRRPHNGNRLGRLGLGDQLERRRRHDLPNRSELTTRRQDVLCTRHARRPARSRRRCGSGRPRLASSASIRLPTSRKGAGRSRTQERQPVRLRPGRRLSAPTARS